MRSEWAPLDPALVAGGAIAVLLNLLRGFRDRRALAAGILGVFPLGFLARGGVVFDFYVLVAVPFLCLNLAVLLSGSFRRAPAAAAAAALAAVAMVGWGYPGSARVAPIFAERPADAERQAVAWTKANVSPKSRIITQDDLWPALRQPGKEGPAFPNVHSHWKVAHDPDVRNGVFDEDWRLVDYLLLSPGTERDLEAAGNAVAVEALRNARKMKTWTEAGTTVELWRVEAGSAPDFTVLRRSDGFIRARFERGGAFPDAEGVVRSEAQARAMLRAVWLGDRAAFERAWRWTAGNLRDPGGLLAWRWRDGQVEDPRTSADADTEAALALLMAGRLWDDRGLVEEGTRMARAIWQREVVRAGGLPHVAAGDWATGLDPVPLNPGAFAPYAYRVFKEVDPEHDWWGAVEAGYRVLAAASEDRLGQARSSGLPPDWAGLDRSSGRVGPLPLEGRDTTGYSSEAARVFWRVAVDLRWSNDGRARTFLEEAGGFLRDEVDRKGAVASAYAHDGEVLDQDPSMVGAAGALGALLPDPDRAQAFAAERVLGAARLRREATVWGDPADLQTQEWGWLAAALATGAVRDIWHGG